MIGLTKEQLDAWHNKLLLQLPYHESRANGLPLWDITTGEYCFIDMDSDGASHTKLEPLSSIMVDDDSDSVHDLLVRVSCKEDNRLNKWRYMTMLSTDYKEFINHGE